MNSSALGRLTISRGRFVEIATACIDPILLALLVVFRPQIPANHILTWNELDSIIVLVVGDPLCLFWIASAKSFTLTLLGSANRADRKSVV